MNKKGKQEGDAASAALDRIIELNNKLAGGDLGVDDIEDNISDRINASEDLKKILEKARENQRKSYHQWRASD
tara:strand:+ start:3283 stop:3501 length:219 start_codon:yes stop_codon:yes gene_type:complete